MMALAVSGKLYVRALSIEREIEKEKEHVEDELREEIRKDVKKQIEVEIFRDVIMRLKALGIRIENLEPGKDKRRK